MATSFRGTTKQSPSPQHHSPAELRSAPRDIQESWASACDARERRAKTAISRASIPDMEEFLLLSRRGDRLVVQPIPPCATGLRAPAAGALRQMPQAVHGATRAAGTIMGRLCALPNKICAWTLQHFASA